MTTLPTTDAHYTISGHKLDAPQLPAGLYVVSTPIGNLRDITLRALETLAAATLVLCEDTRHSARLLDHYGIRASKAALHQHNEVDRIPSLIARLSAGESLALISDAGTPLVSDPGFPLVRAVREAGFDVIAIPGPSALLTALSSAGLPTDRFAFQGFLSPKAGARKSVLEALSQRAETMVFYESPRRLAATLAAMAEVFGANRIAVVSIELTKRFERSFHNNLGELAAQFEDAETKGEVVISVHGAMEEIVDDANWQDALGAAMLEQPLRVAVDDISQTYGVKRKQVYDAALALKKARAE